MLQTAGGAVGDHEAERDGEWPFPVSALWGGARLLGQLISVLQRLQEGKTLLWLPNLDLLCDFTPWLLGVYVVHVSVCPCVQMRAHTCPDILSFLARRVRTYG